MKYQLAIFDFDGTLADSFPFFVSTFNHIARKHAFRQIDHTEIEALRGYGARDLMKKFGIPPWKLPLVANSFIAMMKENQHAIPLFSGIPESLAHIAGREVTLAVVSSNSEENVRRILGPAAAHLQVFECGASIFGKASRLRKLLRRFDVAPQDAIYVGDQPTDCEAAKAANIAFGAVSWGYGTPEAFAGMRPDMHFRRVEDFRRIAGDMT